MGKTINSFVFDFVPLSSDDNTPNYYFLVLPHVVVITVKVVMRREDLKHNFKLILAARFLA